MSEKLMEEEVLKLSKLEEEARLGGGPDKLEQQRKMGR